MMFRIDEVHIEAAKPVGKQYSNLQVSKVSLDYETEQTLNLFVVQGSSKTPAIRITDGNSKVITHVVLIDVRICKQNAAPVSLIVKNAYSCKNVV
jgi:hypothetical protein